MAIGIKCMVDRRKEHLEMLNKLSVITIVNMSKHSVTEYEINDGKIVAEVVNVKWFEETRNKSSYRLARLEERSGKDK